MAEVRNLAEGSLRFVQASGAAGWATASAPISALVGFVQAGVRFNSAANMALVKDRGVPNHHKRIGAEAIEVQFTFLQAVTANIPNPATASGASTKQVHMELRHQVDEQAAASGQYFQFMNGVRLTQGWTEAEAGNQFQETWRFLSMTGPTASGYLG
jgi:hypothetical protein